MEFTIDFAIVRKVTAQEEKQARAEIVACGVLAAYQRSLERHDARLAAAPDSKTLACKAGCSWCCHFSVDVRPVEAFNILNYMQQNFTSDETARVRSEIEANRSLLKTLSEFDRIKRNVKCPFLMAGRCTIYPVRPQTCRNYHATDAAGCKQSFEEPDNLEIDPDFAPLTYQIGGAHVDAFSTAMQAAGYDVRAYELSAALSAALQDPDAWRRFAAKQKSFNDLDGTEVPTEFMDSDDATAT